MLISAAVIIPVVDPSENSSVVFIHAVAILDINCLSYVKKHIS